MASAGGTRRSFGLGAVMAAAMAVSAGAQPASASVHRYPVDLQVIDREAGQPLRQWRHRGRLFVAGNAGDRYGLRVTNQSDSRVLLVLSVDGVNILTGETASYDQRGYVLGPYQSYDVNGWRKSTTEVAAFAFAPLPRSYAARTGRPNDVGVIGLAVFKEKAPPPAAAEVSRALEPTIRDQARRESRAPAGLARNGPPIPPPAAPQRLEEPAGKAAPSSESYAARIAPRDAVVTARRQDEKLGTAHGAREWSVARQVTFERATRHPQSVRQIEYDTYANLVASGVIPPSPYAQRRPRPFPSRPGYVPDPPGEY